LRILPVPTSIRIRIRINISGTVVIIIVVFFGQMLYDPFGVSVSEVNRDNKVVVDTEDVVCRRKAMSHGGMELLIWGGGSGWQGG